MVGVFTGSFPCHPKLSLYHYPYLCPYYKAISKLCQVGYRPIFKKV